MRLSVIGCAAVISAAAVEATAQDGTQGLLRYPDASRTHVVCVFGDDLWLAPREGGVATPLASPPGLETFPRFSPDGKSIAFVGNYDGNRDLYTVPVAGGIPSRVTWHPTGETLADWLADGRLLFFAGGLGLRPRVTELFTVPASGGMPERLPVPYGALASVSADGTWLAYTPHTRDGATWKRYRGGQATDIWLFNLKTREAQRVTTWEGTDTSPMWNGETLWYLSDEAAPFRLNLWSYDRKTGKRTQVTKFTDFDIRWPAMGPGADGSGEIVFQNGTGLGVLDCKTGKTRTVTVSIPGARPSLRPRAVDAAKYIEGWALSPSGKRALVEARGDIWSLPSEKGSARNLTRTSGVAERDPAWSPDGTSIAWLSDATGEYELWLAPADGAAPARKVTSDGSAFRYDPAWSPDAKWLVFTDKTGTLFVHEVATGQNRAVDKDPWGIEDDVVGASWSNDSRWIAYAKGDADSRTTAIWLYEVATGARTKVTSGFFNDLYPVFDRTGDYLYFRSSRHFQPTYGELDSSFLYAGTEILLVVPLRRDQASPFAPKSDEEEGKKEDKKDEKKDAKPADGAAAADDGVSGTWEGTLTAEGLPGPVPFALTLKLAADGTVTGSGSAGDGSASVEGTFTAATGELRLTARSSDGSTWTATLTIKAGELKGSATLAATGMTGQVTAKRKAEAGAEGKGKGEGDGKKGDGKEVKAITIHLDGFERRAVALPVKPGKFGRLAVNSSGALVYVRRPIRGANEPAEIFAFDVKAEKREEKSVAKGGDFTLSADGKKLLVPRGDSATIQDASAGASGTPVPTAGMTAWVEPREEWRQLFVEAWRLERDFFYEPTMHGLDWQAVRRRYEPLLEASVTREDVSYVIRELISELNVGHAYYSGGDVGDAPSVPVGLLGCDWETAEGAWRIARLIEGAAWDVDGRGPLSQPGVDVKAGDFVLAVNGVALDPGRPPFAAFLGLAGRAVTLTVSAKAVRDAAARQVVVTPIESEGALRYRAFVEKNRAYVEQKTGRRVGYLHVPDTGVNGQNELVRQFFGQLGKGALIIDERWNGGGQIPTRFVELLNRPATNAWARRDGADWPWPPDAHQGPKCMLINEHAGSGGDAFPSYFKQRGLGKLIGIRTWGGLVGLSGNPRLIDGGNVTVPTFGYYKLDGTWGIEGHGVDPDIEVLDDPAKMADGADPQLDAAIAHILVELEKNPWRAPKRPASPNRAGMGIPERDR